MKPVYKCRDGFREEKEEDCVLLMDEERRIRLSKLMSALLRHIPWEAGLKLRRGGWVPVEELAEAIRERWRHKERYRWVTPEHIAAVAVLDPKGRFELKGGLIRARYGHSVSVEIPYEEDKEIRLLYHGTRLDRLGAIMREGLKPMKRLYVHLSRSVEQACETARRHKGIPIYLEIDADCLRSMGIKVYRASRETYLADQVPPECIRRWTQCLKDRS